MDDPDVDHELIALLRESLGFSNKAQDGVTSNTGKAHDFFVKKHLLHTICHATPLSDLCDVVRSRDVVTVLLTRS